MKKAVRAIVAVLIALTTFGDDEDYEFTIEGDSLMLKVDENTWVDFAK